MGELTREVLLKNGFEDDPTDVGFMRILTVADPYRTYLCVMFEDGGDMGHNGWQICFQQWDGTQEDFFVVSKTGMLKTELQLVRLLECLGLR